MEPINKHRYKNQRDNNNNNNPSFSSTLLDVIYRSIDERDEQESVVYRRTMKKRQSIDGCFHADKQKNSGNGGLTKVSGDGEVLVRRNSAAAGTGTGGESCSQRSEGDSFFFNSNNDSSSFSSYGVGFQSSEIETIYGFPARLKPRPKPIRTTSIEDDDDDNYNKKHEKQIEMHESNDLQTKKTKSKAMKKIYSYLKKGKQPISPGGRLGTFLISLFTIGNGNGNGKKSTISSSSCTAIHDDDIIHSNRKSKSKSKSKSANVSTISSTTTSISRSFFNKTPTTAMKRSVRFYPDEYRQHRGNRSNSNSPSVKLAKESFNEELKKHLTQKKNNQIEETRMNLLKNYQKKVEYVIDSIKINSKNDEDEDYDEAGSYASSDLFELDHLSPIGKDLIMEELPLYETTSIHVNRAIANGLLE